MRDLNNIVLILGINIHEIKLEYLLGFIFNYWLDNGKSLRWLRRAGPYLWGVF